MTPFTQPDRALGHAEMRKSITPAARVRRRFLSGRPAKRDVLHTPLSAINAAIESLTEVVGYVAEKEPTLLPPDNVAVWVVCLSSVHDVVRRVYPDHEHIRTLLDELASLPDFRCIGLTFFIREFVDGVASCGRGWVKPFIWSADNLVILDVVLKKQIEKFGKGGTD
jgi:hypothetical protein